MKANFYLIVNERGTTRTVRKRSYALEAGEIAVKMSLEIPNEAFKTPAFEAALVIPKNKVKAYEIPTEMQNKIQTAVETSTGFKCKLTVAENEEEE